MTDQLTEADVRATKRRIILHWLDDTYADQRPDARERRLISALVDAELRCDRMAAQLRAGKDAARIAAQRLERALRDVAPDHPLLTPLRAVEPIRGDG